MQIYKLNQIPENTTTTSLTQLNDGVSVFVRVKMCMFLCS